MGQGSVVITEMDDDLVTLTLASFPSHILGTRLGSYEFLGLT